MNPNLRRALLIAGFVVVTVGWFFVIYLVFFHGARPIVSNNTNGFVNGLPNPSNGNTNRVVPPRNTNALPVINGSSGGPSPFANGGATTTETVSSTPTSDLTALADHSALQYYDRRSGQLYKLSPDGTQKTLLTTDTYPGAQAVDWAPNGGKAILSFPDDSKILYDFGAKKQITLPKELSDFSFSPQSDEIVSKYLDSTNPQNQWLVVSQPDGSQSVSVEQLGENAGNVTTAWSPNNQIVATYQKSTNSDSSDIFFLGNQGQNFPSVGVQGRGFTPNWSPDGRRLLYSTYSSLTDDNPHLYIMTGSPDQLGASQLDLGLDTRADKCTFSQNGFSIYCGVPYYLNPGSGPDPSLSANVPDNIYKIDLLTGSATLIARPVDGQNSQRFSATNLTLSATEDMLFFTDAKTGTIQRIRLR